MDENKKERHRLWAKQYRQKMSEEQREKVRASARLYQATHREKLLPVMREYSKKRFASDRRIALFEGAKRRAKIEGLPFTITIDDIIIPDVCPVLGIPIVTGLPANDPRLPSLDKFVPQLGYVPGNVAVISVRANSLKRDAIVEEIRLLYNWMLSCSAS